MMCLASRKVDNLDLMRFRIKHLECMYSNVLRREAEKMSHSCRICRQQTRSNKLIAQQNN